VLALSVLVHPAFANTPSPRQQAARASDRELPQGLPGLPSFGETMQRDSRLGLALNGFDPVSYRLGAPSAGSAQHELLLDGVVWRFASAANLAAFRDAPEIYVPAFGGFDATGVAAGIAVDSDPGQFAVVGSQLFLFRSAENRQRFLGDRSLLSTARSRWAAVASTVAR
jgi:YHS domain-containing protein